jgi:hypothetical protein
MADIMISFLFPGVEIVMRAIVLAVLAIQVGLAHPACAETSLDTDRSIREMRSKVRSG